jgi:hypothetical protein
MAAKIRVRLKINCNFNPYTVLDMRTSFKIIILLLFACFFITGCFKNLSKSTVVYYNDFETGADTGFTLLNGNGLLPKPYTDSFNSGKVMGRFWETRLEFESPELPAHNLINIEFILNTHGYWEGNKIIGGLPDLWNLAMDGALVYSTTFSNSSELQSYPDWYGIGLPAEPPKGNAFQTNLPGVCSLKGVEGGTVSYKITFVRPHSSNTVHLTISDVLHNSICDKSWSIDNLKITTLIQN